MRKEWWYFCVNSGNLLIVISVRKQKTAFLTMTKWVVQVLLPWRLRGVSERLDVGSGLLLCWVVCYLVDCHVSEKVVLSASSFLSNTWC